MPQSPETGNWRALSKTIAEHSAVQVTVLPGGLRNLLASPAPNNLKGRNGYKTLAPPKALTGTRFEPIIVLVTVSGRPNAATSLLGKNGYTGGELGAESGVLSQKWVVSRA